MAFFSDGQKVWVVQPDGSQRPAIFVGEAEQATWFGGPPLAYDAYPDTEEGEAALLERITARD